jgi:hypothetical protein
MAQPSPELPPPAAAARSLAMMVAGMALMKATSLRLALTRTPMCQSRLKPGGCSAHCRNSAE